MISVGVERQRASRAWTRSVAIALWLIVAVEIMRPGAATNEPATSAHPAFERFAPFVRSRTESGFVWIESDGLPHAPLAHPIMQGIRRWQQQVPLPQPYRGENAWRFPIQPRLAESIVSTQSQLLRGAIAIAVNGVPIFNALNNRGEDAYLAGELDEYGGHCGRADDYHYHVAPLALLDIVGRSSPIAYSLDGFAIYAPLDGRYATPCPLDGREPLDECAGHFGRAADGSRGAYHYHGSERYPYIQGGIRGVIEVEGDQISPQPRALSVRPALTALAGARTKRFSALSENSWRLEYELDSRTHAVEYSLLDDSAEFDFLSPDGTKRHESYPRLAVRREPGEANRGRDRDKRPKGPEGEPRTPWIIAHAQELDANSDGSLALTELRAEVARTFLAFDLDRNGILTQEERDEGKAPKTVLAGFLRGHAVELDTDGDGEIGRSELAGAMDRFFEKEDSNDDGVLTEDELQAKSAVPASPRSQAPQKEKGERAGDPNRKRSGSRQSEEFPTSIPNRPFDLVLSAPTHSTITLSVVSGSAALGFVEFGEAGSDLERHTQIQRLDPQQPASFVLDGLVPGRAYSYRYRHLAASSAETLDPTRFDRSETFSFRTPRAKGHEFTFTVIADSHLDSNVDPAVYSRTLAHARAAQPDLHLDLGDTFMTDKYPRYEDALPHYLAQHDYFSQLGCACPIFLALGNHDGEDGSRDRAMTDWSRRQRTRFFPPPPITVTQGGTGFAYTGRTAATDLDGAHYYSFEWGDACFIVLDPYGLTKSRVRGGGRNAELPPSQRLTDDSWARTLGKEQYDWLSETLERTRAKYIFVFTHHLVGGFGSEARGGVEASRYFEWGGRNADDSSGFAQRRPDLALPIHDLLVRHQVSAVFHGHDHMYVHAERDGLTYQCVAQPGNPRGNTRSAADYGYRSGTLLGSPGHLRVRVARDGAHVEFVRTELSGAEDGKVVDSYSIAPRSAKPDAPNRR